jgi:hypothetical protein
MLESTSVDAGNMRVECVFATEDDYVRGACERKTIHMFFFKV